MKKIYDDRYEQPITDEKPLPLSAHPNFDNSLVNLDYSAVHVPVNVYDVSEKFIQNCTKLPFC